MSEMFYTVWNDVKQSIVFILLGGMGGIVYLIVSNKRLLRWSDYVKAFVVAAFAGFVGGTICDACGLTQKMQWIGGALSGVAGGFGLLWFLVFACKKLGVDLTRIIKDVQSLREALDNHTAPVPPTSREVLEYLLREGRITKQEFSALFCGYVDVLEDMRVARRLSIAEYEILKAADFLQGQRCPEKPKAEEV